MLCVRSFLELRFALTNASIFSIMSSMPDILSCISCVLLVKLPFVVPVHVPKIFVSKFPLVFIFFTDSASIFQEGRLEEKVCINVDSLDMAAERKVRLQLMDCYRAENETGDMEGKVKIYSWCTCFPGQQGLWVPRKCLWTKQ